MEEGHATTRIRLASALAVDVPGGGTLTGQALGSRKARTLLALLAAERGGPVSLDRIVETLWPDDPPADPAANVATLVSRTRRVLGPGVLAATGRAYGLAEDGLWRVDLDEAAGLCAEAAARAAAGEHLLAAAGARAALDASRRPGRLCSTRPTPTGSRRSGARPTPCAGGPVTCWPSR